MRIGASPESFVEYLAFWGNLAPIPLAETQTAFIAARSIMAAAALGIFDALAKGPLGAEAIAKACNTHPSATKHLVDCLTGLKYLKYADGRYENAAVADKWLVRSSPVSVHDKLVFQMIEWQWMANLEDFVRTGNAVDIHHSMSPAEWVAYQDGMRAVAAGLAPQIAKKLPVPKGATRMLDIGGSHGLYSAALCKRHPSLNAVILELPAAAGRAAENLAKVGMGSRIVHREGDALADDLGRDEYDFILISNLVHHFNVEQNIDLAKRCARALKPGGVFVIGEYVRNDSPGSGGAVGATADLYFALTSTSGTWSAREMVAWQKGASLVPASAISFAVMPGFYYFPATKVSTP